jgi:UDP-2,3-diacylglucosamine hydrolase
MTDVPVLYIAGDVHLRGDAGPFAAWLDELVACPPARLVILGDLFDYWLETDGAVRRYAGVLMRFRALRRLGWRIDLVRGNRELVAGRRLAAAAGAPLHWPACDVELGPLRVRIVHGDRLCHDPGLRTLTAWMSGFWFRAWQAGHPGVVQEWVARFMRRSSQRTQRQRNAVGYSGRRPFLDPRRVRAAARGADVLVAGHIHEQWRRRVGGIDVMLVGDWPGRAGHWIEGFADGRLAPVSRFFPACPVTDAVVVPPA